LREKEKGMVGGSEGLMGGGKKKEPDIAKRSRWGKYLSAKLEKGARTRGS